MLEFGAKVLPTRSNKSLLMIHNNYHCQDPPCSSSTLESSKKKTTESSYYHWKQLSPHQQQKPTTNIVNAFLTILATAILVPDKWVQRTFLKQFDHDVCIFRHDEEKGEANSKKIIPLARRFSGNAYGRFSGLSQLLTTTTVFPTSSPPFLLQLLLLFISRNRRKNSDSDPTNFRFPTTVSVYPTNQIEAKAPTLPTAKSGGKMSPLNYLVG